MGNLFARWKTKQTTQEVLERLEKEIQSLESTRKNNMDRERRLVGSLLLYSVVSYIVAALLFYFYYLPDTWLDRLMCSSPLLAFALLVWIVKRFLHWYFVKRIARNESALVDLKGKKHKILDEVMETETYKKAKEILEKYDPERHREVTQDAVSQPVQAPDGQEVRQRSGSKASGSPKHLPSGPQPSDSPTSTPQLRRPSHLKPPPPRLSVQGPASLPLPRPVLPRDRTIMDRFVEYVVGDGPQNRFALICKNCSSHNGMALKEEFEFLSFRCCYCYTLNTARKQKAYAPRLDGTPVPPQDMRPRQAAPDGKESADRSVQPESDEEVGKGSQAKKMD